MMQIPFLFRQPGRIPAGGVSDLLVSNYDFLPSVLGHLGLADRMPRAPRSPGRDFSPVLRGEKVTWDGAVFYEFETCRAVRTDTHKLVLRHPAGPHELYDMRADPMERFNLFGQPGTDALTAALRTRLHTFFDTYSDPQYNIWRGGRSKAKRQTEGP
jgi:arylsulfatase A-like enzyme